MIINTTDKYGQKASFLVEKIVTIHASIHKGVSWVTFDNKAVIELNNDEAEKVWAIWHQMHDNVVDV